MHGFVATGTMGEAGSLSSEERRTVVQAVVEAAAGRVPVTVGVSSGSALTSLAYALDAKNLGATAIMSLPPLGYRADDDEVIGFFTELAPGTGLPLMAYNNPEASGVDMPPELIVRIYEEVDGVAAIKECSGDVRRISAILNADERARGAGRRRRLGARGLRGRRDRLGHRRRRRGAARGRRALRRGERGRAGQRRARCTVGCSRSRAST